MTTSSDLPESRPPLEILRAYLELVRAPNLFTAMADVVMGFLFAHSANPFLSTDQQLILALLIGASTCLYVAGMVLNDVFDIEIDARERPERPIPSGRIPLGTARRLGWTLLAAGVVLASAAAGLAGSFSTGMVAALLAACIVLYDRVLKRTPLGPLGMGACRMLNVLLGVSACLWPWGLGHWLAAGAIGIYITGVTWLARNETGNASRWQLALATLVILAGIAVLFVLPYQVERRVALFDLDPHPWYLLIGILIAYTGMRCFQTVAEPEPEVIQSAVKHCILSLVILDGVICYIVWDWAVALTVIVVLLAPSLVFGRWIHST